MRNTILQFLFLIFYITTCVISVYVTNEQPIAKPTLHTEELPWLAFFDRKSQLQNYSKANQIQERKNSNSVSHSTLCPPGETGQYPYPPDCKRFINCWKGRGSIQVCAPGTLFNAETLECDFPGKVKCIGGFDSEIPMATGGRYVRFSHQRPETEHNPRIAKKNQNDPSESKEIPSTSNSKLSEYVSYPHRRLPTRLGNQNPENSVRPLCALGATGLYPHPHDCTKFLKCWSGNTFIQNCGPGTFFNPLISACDHPRNVPCSHDADFRPEQAGETEVTADDIQIPEETVQFEKYQRVNISLGTPNLNEAKNTYIQDPDSPDYNVDSPVKTHKSPTSYSESNRNPLEVDVIKRKPKIINIGSQPQKNHVRKNHGQPGFFLQPPQYGVDENGITTDNNYRETMNIQPGHFSTNMHPQNPSDTFLINYPPQGPYSVSQTENSRNADETRNYHGYLLNEKNFHPKHHPHHSHYSHNFHQQHSQNSHHTYATIPTWLVPPSFHPQYHSHYAPYHPFSSNSRSESPHYIPQASFHIPMHVMHIPYYPRDFSEGNLCSSSVQTSSKDSDASKCNPSVSFYEPTATSNSLPSNFPQEPTNKSNRQSSYAPSAPQISSFSGPILTHQLGPNYPISDIHPYEQKMILQPGFGEEINNSNGYRPDTVPSENQKTPHLQLELGSSKPKHPTDSQVTTDFNYKPQGANYSASINNTYSPNVKQMWYYHQVPVHYTEQRENLNNNPNYFTVYPQSYNQGNIKASPGQSNFPLNYPQQQNSLNQSQNAALQKPQYQPYLFYYYPSNSNPYSNYYNQNVHLHIPPKVSNNPSTFSTEQTSIPNPFATDNVNLSSQFKIGEHTNKSSSEKSTEKISINPVEIPDHFDSQNRVFEDDILYAKKQYPYREGNIFQAKKQSETVQESPVYNPPKVSPGPGIDSNTAVSKSELKDPATFPPFPESIGGTRSEETKPDMKEDEKFHINPHEEYLLGKIDVRTGAESEDSLVEAEVIMTTKQPAWKKDEEKVHEAFAKGNNKKPLQTVPNKYSQLEETNKINKENGLKKFNVKSEDKQNLSFGKRLKPESDFDDYLKLEIQKPEKKNIKPHIKVKKTPPNGQTVRLRNGASHLDGYLEMKDSSKKWGLICDHPGQWGIAEATVACRELGFIRGAELSWQGYPIKSESEKLHVAALGVNCTGTETSFSECGISGDEKTQCEVGRNAVGLRCFDNLASHCQPGEILYNQHCYKLHEKENPDDPWIKTEEASEQCKKHGGKLVDITSQYENDFISEWLIKKHPDVTAVATGGIGISVLGRPMWLWEGTSDPMVYERWWSGWSGDQDIPKGSIDGPLCIVLRKTFSCADDNNPQKIAELTKDEETCSADYFFWDVEDCDKLRTSVFICERPMDDIGCVIGHGEAYVGTANTTASGLACLPWDHPKAVEGLARRGSAQERSSRLVGHNYCRNLGNPDRHPWCFVEGRGNSEYCAIPQCWASVSGLYSRSLGKWTSCSADHFECKPGECIRNEWVCDGQKDCINGRDEDGCKVFLQEFTTIRNKRLNVKANESWPNVNENICAKLCLENKNFKCRSFSYNFKNKVCLVSESNLGLSGQVINDRGWVYHERSSESLKCTLENGFFECQSGKCVNVSNVCDGKKHCEEGSDEKNCSLLGYQIRLVGSEERYKGRIEVKILGKWGVICDDMFDMRDATVVCRELGFKLGASEVLKHSEFPVENPLFLIDKLDCLGNETTIRECSFPGWGKHNCGPEEVQIVGVQCRATGTECLQEQWQCKKSKECISLEYLCDQINDCDDGTDEEKSMCESSTQIRLVGGPNETSGRLEIRRYNIWGTVCHDDFNVEAGESVCRLLGFNGSSTVKKSAYFGKGKGPIWLDSGLCFINETSLEECARHMNFQNNCNHDEDVSLICNRQEFLQKSTAIKPVAMSSDTSLIGNTEDKLRQVLLSECNNELPVKSRILDTYEKVVGGSSVAREALPWQASVRVRSGSGKSVHWCGAVVISQFHVLTAGHCLRDYNKAAYFIRVGDYDTKVPDPNEQEFGIEQLFMHPEFSKTINLNNDIGLVKIKGEINLKRNIKPACLAPSVTLYRPGTNCSISGWGSVSASSAGYARTLRRAYVPILDTSVCRAQFVYGNSLSDGMFCAGYLDGGVDSCQGDSGGPLMCQYDGKEYLFGITSWGHGCGRPNKPGVYTNVAFYSDWIQQKIQTSL